MRIGCIHGRFQPFHKEHMRYALAALEKCDFLWVGITRYEILRESFEAGQGRDSLLANPFTYIERVNIIRDALLEQGVEQNRFGFVPFPIDSPELLPQFVSLSTTCYTTVREDWNKDKIKSLKALGYEVVVLWEDLAVKRISSTIIRESIRSGDGVWKEMVFESTRRHMKSMNARQRLCQRQE